MNILARIAAWWRKTSKRQKLSCAFWLIISVNLVVASQFVDFTRSTDRSGTTISAGDQKPSTNVERELNYTEFIALANEKRFKTATIGYTSVKATLDDGTKVIMNHRRWLYDSAFPKELHERGIEVVFENNAPGKLSTFIANSFPILMGTLTLAVFSVLGIFLMMQVRQLASPGWPKNISNSPVRFSDVAGHDEASLELEEIKTFLQSPEDYQRVGARSPRGVLLVGPPGTGKTLLAKALAGETGANFISVSGSDFTSTFIGVGRNRVEKLFKQARAKKPCIIFIDEIDSLARKRGASSTDLARESDTTLNQILVEMDGFTPTDGVIVVGATNRIDVLDDALLRPGRFDRHIHVGLPTLSGRLAILNVHTKDRPLADGLDLEPIARGTSGFSGADLANLINEAAVLAARRSSSVIESADMDEARDKIIMGLKRKSLVMDDEERHLIAVHEAGHALVACLMPESDPVHQATIVPRGRALGLVMRLPVKDRVIVRRSKLNADLTVLMGGRAAEEIVFGEENVSNGAAADIEHATSLARKMVMQWGMGKTSKMLRIDDADNDSDIRAEVRDLLDDFYQKARNVISENRPALDALTAALLERETIDGDEVRAIIGRAA